MPQTVKKTQGNLWAFLKSSLLGDMFKRSKNEWGPLETLKNFYKTKKSRKTEKNRKGIVRFRKCTKKFLTEAATRTRLCYVSINP